MKRCWMLAALWAVAAAIEIALVLHNVGKGDAAMSAMFASFATFHCVMLVTDLYKAVA